MVAPKGVADELEVKNLASVDEAAESEVSLVTERVTALTPLSPPGQVPTQDLGLLGSVRYWQEEDLLKPVTDKWAAQTE